MEANQESKVSEPRTIRLLLHAIDGLVPYLTPQLLRTCFPLEETDDRLWMGIAVKDTCVVPSFPADADLKQSHPRGYEFTSQANVDPWMRAFTRVTVPTFDMAEDAKGRQRAKDAAVVVTDQHVMMWTGNGRQPLTPNEYFASARGLASHYTVPLFDPGALSPIKKKRWIAAQRRTQEWTMDYRERHASDEKGTLYPVLLAEGMPDKCLDEQLQHLDNCTEDSEKAGIVLIGWSHLPKSLQRTCLEHAADRSTRAPVAILSTTCLAQVLLAACHGATLIGSNLPQRWAYEKRVFLFEIDGHLDNREPSEPPPKRTRRNDVSTKNSSSRIQLDANGCLDLNPLKDRVEDHHWYRDKQPAMPGCTCYVCRTHSRAYLYHLVCAKEMLAEVLLFIHNLHQMLKVLRCIELSWEVPDKRTALIRYIESLNN